MRYLILSVLVLFLLLSFREAKPQDFEVECGMTEGMDEPSQSPTLHYVGKYVTSSGTLRVLVIFVRFADDNETSAIWPNPAVLPEWGGVLCE